MSFRDSRSPRLRACNMDARTSKGGVSPDFSISLGNPGLLRASSLMNSVYMHSHVNVFGQRKCQESLYWLGVTSLYCRRYSQVFGRIRVAPSGTLGSRYSLICRTFRFVGIVVRRIALLVDHRYKDNRDGTSSCKPFILGKDIRSVDDGGAWC